jgi:hypothetical protein
MFVERHIVRFLGGSEKRLREIPIGEVDGLTHERTVRIAAALAQMAGYTVKIRPDLDD